MADPIRERPRAPAAPAPRPATRPVPRAAPAVRVVAPPAVALVPDAGPGVPLPAEVAVPLSQRLGADLSAVRVHQSGPAQRAVAALGTRAFTVGTSVFLGPNERASDLGLMAHEVTHVLQQTAGPAVHLFDGPHGGLEHEAHSASAAVSRGESVVVQGRTLGQRAQGWSITGGLKAIGGAISSAVSAVASIGKAALDKAVDFVRDKASSIPGYGLLGFVLGRDPITQKPVERTAGNFIRALVTLIPGGAAVLANLEQARVIQRAGDWLGTEVPKLGLSWAYVRGLFSALWDKLGVSDLLSPGSAWEKVKSVFGPPLVRLKDFAVSAGKKLLEFVFEGAIALGGGAAQQVLAIFRRIGAVFGLIVNDPVRFLGNLLNAVKGGFTGFAKNILAHLRTALFEWLLGALGGALKLPSKFDFAGIVSIIMQVLGLTYAALRGLLVKIIGEPAVAFVEKAFEFLVLVVTKGLSAAWEKIKEFATDLADTVISGIRDWVAKSVVGAAITKLVTLFNPVGAIIQAIISIYNTVMFFIERAKQIARVVNSVLDSVEAIAKGSTAKAAQFVERTMAQTLPVIIAFLARLVGLGNVTEHVRNIIKKIQTTISKALERMANWIAGRVKGLLGKGKPPAADAAGAKPDVRQRAGQLVAERLKGKETPGAEINSVVASVRSELRPHGLKKLEFTSPDAEGDAYLVANASSDVKVGKKSSAGPKAPRARTRTVVLRATVRLPADKAQKAIEGLTFGAQNIPRRPGDPRGGIPGTTGVQQAAVVTDVPPSQAAAGRSAAYVLKPVAGATELKVVTFNSGLPVPLTNDSHAERFFLKWFETVQSFGVISVEIDINLSPCSTCAGFLRSMRDKCGDLKLHYKEPYLTNDRNNILNENVTTVEDLREMRGWQITGTTEVTLTRAQRRDIIQSNIQRYIQTGR